MSSIDFNNGIEKAAKIIEAINRPSALRLMCGELSVGETRLLKAVLLGIVDKIRREKN